ncbi:MAG: SH3 domain-containing protein [Thermoanaerobaculia bacterium]
MRRILYALALLTFALRCATPAPAPPPAVEVVPPPPVEEKVVGTATVNASALNVRAEATGEAEVVVQLKRGTKVSILDPGESWTKVRLANGDTGFAATRFLKREGESTSKSKAKGKKSCPADSDFAFLETPMLTFSDSGAHGLVVVDATVNTNGNVVSTKLVSNSTGDEALAFLTEREIKSAKFAPPIRSCVPRTFIFTYRRTF